jgi:hypothetical protein
MCELVGVATTTYSGCHDETASLIDVNFGKPIAGWDETTAISYPMDFKIRE